MCGGEGLRSTAGAEPVCIEKASREDLPSILAVMRECSDAPQWPSQSWTEFLEGDADGPSRRLLIAAKSVGGGIKGWLAASLVMDRTELEFVVVRSESRGLGYGKQLLGAWIAWASDRGATDAWLEVRLFNNEALHLYRSLGFSEQGRRNNYYQAPREDAVVMRLALPALSQPEAPEPATR